MKKVIVMLFVSLLLFSITSCKKTKLEKIKVAEVARSVFYAPQYVALTNGYFEEVGLDIELFNANGADKVISVIDSQTLKNIYVIPMRAYPQCSMLLSTGYEKLSTLECFI